MFGAGGHVCGGVFGVEVYCQKKTGCVIMGDNIGLSFLYVFIGVFVID